MGMEAGTENITGTKGNLFYNQPQVDSNALLIRLDTQRLMDDIELFLRGKRYVVTEGATGEIKQEILEVGDALANDCGIQGILSFVGMVVNPHTVQGNYEREQYYEEIARVRRGLAYIMTLNTNKWGITNYNRILIQTSIMNLVKPFMSRLIANKERESYGQSMIREEKTGIQKEGMFTGLNPFKKR